MQFGHLKMAINGDADSELRFWMKEGVDALRLALVFAVATGIAVALLPAGEEGSALAFVRAMWVYLVECAVWLGLFVGLLWSAGKRLGAALGGTLPWQEPGTERGASGRLFGQWTAFAVLAGFFLWLTWAVSVVVGSPAALG